MLSAWVYKWSKEIGCVLSWFIKTFRSFTKILLKNIVFSILGFVANYLINCIFVSIHIWYIDTLCKHTSLHSSHSHDLFLPYARTTMVLISSFASIGPFLRNRLPPLFCSSILCAPLFLSLSRLKSYLFPRTEMHWKHFCLCSEKRYINIHIQYNTIACPKHIYTAADLKATELMSCNCRSFSWVYNWVHCWRTICVAAWCWQSEGLCNWSISNKDRSTH